MNRLLKHSKQRGFTLIELMIVVAIIGILAAVAIPAFMEYMKKGKKSEGNIQMNRLAKSAKAYFVENAGYPTVDEAAKPATNACTVAGKQHTAADWTVGAATDTFTLLEFRMEEKFRFQYDYDSTSATTFEADAVADLDCDAGAAALDQTNATIVRANGDQVGGQPAVNITNIGSD